MSTPHGPIRLSANRQIALPKALTDELHLAPGDHVCVLLSDWEPSGLVVVPADRVGRWVRLGRQAERRASVRKGRRRG